MELTFPLQTCRYLDPVLWQPQPQELTQEIRLPEGMPDIGRVICAWGQPLLRSKEWNGDQISANGGIMVWILYAPEDGTQLRTVEGWLPVHMSWNHHAQNREGHIRLYPMLRYVDARSTAARKMVLRAGLTVLCQALCSREQTYSTPGEVPEDVQLLRCTYPVRLFREAGEKAFLIDEELDFPASMPRPEKLVYYCVSPIPTEQRVQADRVIFRGDGNLHICYLTGEGRLHSQDITLPFSQLANLDEAAGTDSRADIWMCVTSVDVQLDDAGHLRVKCGLLGQYLVEDRQLLEVVADAYSTKRPSEVTVDSLRVPAVLDRQNKTVPMQQLLHRSATEPVDCGFLADYPQLQQDPEGGAWHLQGQFKSLFYVEDRSAQAAVCHWETEFPFPADEQTQVLSFIQPVSRPVASAAGEELRLAGELSVSFLTISTEGVPMATGMTLSDPAQKEAQRPSLILCRAGERKLWDLAKQTGATVEAIQTANGLDGEPEKDRMLLIPVS